MVSTWPSCNGLVLTLQVFAATFLSPAIDIFISLTGNKRKLILHGYKNSSY